MSKLKTPREKKLASLALDRRNIYGENAKASRKLIPRSKQQSHQAARRAAREPLFGLTSATTEDDLVAAESLTRSREVQGKRNAFRKRRDVPLTEFIERQKYWAQRRADESDYRAARRSPESSSGRQP